MVVSCGSLCRVRSNIFRYNLDSITTYRCVRVVKLRDRLISSNIRTNPTHLRDPELQLSKKKMAQLHFQVLEFKKVFEYRDFGNSIAHDLCCAVSTHWLERWMRNAMNFKPFFFFFLSYKVIKKRDEKFLYYLFSFFSYSLFLFFKIKND